MPSKLYGILAAGRPYLTTAPAGCELFQITKEREVGFTVLPDPVEIAEGIRLAKSNPDQLQTMRSNARVLAVAECTKQQSIDAFRTLLKNTCVASPVNSQTV